LFKNLQNGVISKNEGCTNSIFWANMTPILTNNYRLIPDIFTTFSIKLVDLFFFYHVLIEQSLKIHALRYGSLLLHHQIIFIEHDSLDSQHYNTAKTCFSYLIKNLNQDPFARKVKCHKILCLVKIK